MRRRTDFACPCRAREAEALAYLDCCGGWHAGLADGRHPPTPEALMRSRYSAYALAQGRGTGDRSHLAYLLATWHPATAPGDLELGPLAWTGLDVLHAETGEDAGVVEFVAHHKTNGRAAKVHELSRFVREGGVWLYVDGVVTPAGAG